jgi:hypothetical protein
MKLKHNLIANCLFYTVFFVHLNGCLNETGNDDIEISKSLTKAPISSNKDTKKTSPEKKTVPINETPVEEPLNPGRPETCGDILDKFKKPQKATISAKTLKNRFSLKKDLRGESKSGAFPSLVTSKEDNKIKFLKIFPKVKKGQSGRDIVKDQSYLEIYQTCRLSKLNLSANLPNDLHSSKFFVDVYEVGFLKTDDPFVKADQENDFLYPYILSEAVDNITLTKFVTEPREANTNIGFDLDSAPKMVLESILMQIIVALKNPHLAWQLTHHDIHTGNILLSKQDKADFIVDFEGKKMQLVGPLVKIIDFGLGESEGFTQKGSLNFNVWIKKRPFINELEEFIKGVLGDDKISWWTRRRIGLASINQDIYMFNLILRALKPRLNRRGSLVPDKKYCKDYDDCILLMSKWWK